jgi:ankyrin repeat protein
VVARPGRADYYDLMTYIRENSNGVFLWVKLMCDELQRGWGNWDNAMQLQERLKKMPQDLDSMYRRIMETMKREDRDEASRMLAIVSSAARPLSLPEFYHALVYSSATCKRTTRLEKNIHCKYGFPHDLLFDLEVKERSPQYASVKIALEGRIDAICRGMLFVQHGRVRLLHETVEEFFRGAIGWLVESSFTLPSLNGDDLLLRACINYQIGLFECNPPFTWSVRPTGKPNSQEDIKTDDVYIDGEDYRSYHATHSWHLRDNVPLKLSFLLYAVDNWLSHAYKVEKITQRAQNDLIESFYGHSFIIWRHLFGIHHPRQRQTLPLKLIHLIIESGLDLTAEKILQAAVNGQETVCSKELEGYQNKNHLLFSVAKGGCYSVAESVFSLGATFQNPNNNELPMQSNSTGLHMKVEALNRRALHRAIHSGHLALVDLFVHKGADLESEIESKALEQLSNLTADFGVSHLKEFRSKSHYKLSDYGTLQRSNARRSSFLGKTREGKFWSSRALEFAVLCDKKEIFLTLLSYYSEIGQQESLLLALTAAAFKGRIYYIRELLDRGVNPNLPVQRSQGCFILGTHTCYPILPAIYWGYLDIVELLITRGADLNVQAESDYCGRHMPGKKLYSGRPSTPHQVASDRLSKYPSNQMYVDMLSLLEKSGAGLTSNGTKHDMILEELND